MNANSRYQHKMLLAWFKQACGHEKPTTLFGGHCCNYNLEKIHLHDSNRGVQPRPAFRPSMNNPQVRGGATHSLRAQLDRRLLLRRGRRVWRLSEQQGVFLALPDQHIFCVHHHDNDGIRRHLAQRVINFLIPLKNGILRPLNHQCRRRYPQRQRCCRFRVQ